MIPAACSPISAKSSECSAARRPRAGDHFGGTGLVVMDGPRVGQVMYVERVGFVVSGANAAATAALYLDSPQADVDLLDYMGALVGANPSRGVFAAPGGPYLIPNGTPIILVIAGAVAGSQVSVRYQGRLEEVETSGGRV
jgi:hypothetical protein